MGRKFVLKNECRDYLQLYPKGSKVTQHERNRLILAMIEDLAILHELPNRLSLLTAAHIKKLVDHWIAQGTLPATMANRLGALRTLNRLASLKIDIPSNQSLGIIKSFTTLPASAVIDQEIINKVAHPVTRTIIECQMVFGLTKLESIRFSPILSQQEALLFIQRDIAHNKKDRQIPILSEAQKHCLSERKMLIQDRQGLVFGDFSENLIKKLYQAECIHCRVDPNTEFRSFYAKQRLKQLKSQLGEAASLAALCQEMGFNAPHKLERLLA